MFQILAEVISLVARASGPARPALRRDSRQSAGPRQG
ncbi:hypothetical protein J2Z33_000963 [Rubellimicrobium aerolatum]|nr:hypothetical protein [Rubellimicrobium aerolatum]